MFYGTQPKNQIFQITTTGDKEHSKKNQVLELDKFIAKANKTQEETEKVVKSIKCKLIHKL